jgi:hypothetical protein
MNDQQIRRKKLVVGGAVLVGVILFIAFISSGKGNPIDKLPEEGSSVNYSDIAVISKGEELFKDLGGSISYDLFGKDLYYFGKNSYKNYSKEKAVIGFLITSETKKVNNEYVFEGRFGAVSNKISVSVKPLERHRIYTKITDTKTKKDLNSSLPSNNKRNQFIATLPVTKDDFSIDFDETSDTFVINIYDGDPSLYDTASKHLASQIGAKDLTKEKVSLLRSGDLSSDDPIIDIPDQGDQDD